MYPSVVYHNDMLKFPNEETIQHIQNILLVLQLYSNHIPAPLLDMAGICLEYKWDIVNNLDGFFIRISVGTLAYYDIQHLDTNRDTLNIQKN